MFHDETPRSGSEVLQLLESNPLENVCDHCRLATIANIRDVLLGEEEDAEAGLQRYMGTYQGRGVVTYQVKSQASKESADGPYFLPTPPS